MNQFGIIHFCYREEYELLKLLAAKDREKSDAICGMVFHSFRDVEHDNIVPFSHRRPTCKKFQDINTFSGTFCLIPASYIKTNDIEVNDMKLAHALNTRADLQTRMCELEDRLAANARTQEGVPPSENPEKLFAEYEGCASQLEELMARINRTNNETVIDGVTLTELLAKRDCLKMRVRTYQRFLKEASMITSRSMRSEIKVLSTVSVADYRKIVDEYSRELREIDGKIQEANWVTECL